MLSAGDSGKILNSTAENYLSDFFKKTIMIFIDFNVKNRNFNKNI